jgi:hypothetical protein
MKEALSSSETSALTRATWRNIPEDAIVHLRIVFGAAGNDTCSVICGKSAPYRGRPWRVRWMRGRWAQYTHSNAFGWWNTSSSLHKPKLFSCSVHHYVLYATRDACNNDYPLRHVTTSMYLQVYMESALTEVLLYQKPYCNFREIAWNATVSAVTQTLDHQDMKRMCRAYII